jgi:hypothetical protein
MRREVVFDHLYNVSSASGSGLLRSAWMSISTIATVARVAVVQRPTVVLSRETRFVRRPVPNSRDNRLFNRQAHA